MVPTEYLGGSVSTSSTHGMNPATPMTPSSSAILPQSQLASMPPPKKRDSAVKCWCGTFQLGHGSVPADEHVLLLEKTWFLSHLGELIEQGLLEWAIVGHERAPSTGSEHLQCYLVMAQRMRLATMKSTVSATCHWEPAKGTHEQNFVYCSKEGKTSELGTRPPFLTPGQREQNRWTAARQAAAADRLNDVDDQIFVTHHRNIVAIRNESRAVPAMLPVHGTALKTRFKWVYGTPGAGKTKYCWDYFDAENEIPYLKGYNKWWCNFHGQKHTLMDDIPGDATWLVGFIKIWCQERPFSSETKGGTVMIRPQYIWFTSNYHPDAIFPGTADRAAMHRRLDIIFMGDEDDRWHGDFVAPVDLPPQTPPRKIAGAEPPAMEEEDHEVEIMTHAEYLRQFRPLSGLNRGIKEE